MEGLAVEGRAGGTSGGVASAEGRAGEVPRRRYERAREERAGRTRGGGDERRRY